MRLFLIFFSILVLCSCGSNTKTTQPDEPQLVGKVNRYTETADLLIPADARPEVIAEGFSWSEGPLWSDELDGLLFSDVPENKIYLWTEQDGVSVYLEGSGNSGEEWAEGSNGLAFNNEGELIICQHGNRQVARMDAEIANPSAQFTPLITNMDGKRFNSPNDLWITNSGAIYFTDPPYGLPGKDEDESKELDYNGVYLWKDGELSLLVDSLIRPIGMAWSPEESTLYIGISDDKNAFWASYELDSAGLVVSGKIFMNVTDRLATSVGKPDGLKVHPAGWIFATGPGGVYIFDEDATLHALIDADGFVSNCAFDTNFTNLYMTVDDRIMRIPVLGQND